MNIPKTDLSNLIAAVESRAVDGALPSNLDDETLIQIARDLRLIELSCTDDYSVEPPLAGPLFLILHLMRSRSTKLRGEAKFQLPEQRLTHWMQRYMFYLEREIVSRAIKMPNQFDSEYLLAEIEQEVLAAV